MKVMKKRNLYIWILIIFALTVVLVLFLSTQQREENEIKPEEVDYTKNILKNGGFESLNFSYWQIKKSASNKSSVFIDDIVKYDGNYSLSLNSDFESDTLIVLQVIKSVPKDKKIIFSGYLKTEFVDYAFVSLELYSKTDSLIVLTSIDTLRQTNDWQYVTTWVRTINPDADYLMVKCILSGKGRAWFDKLEIFPVDIKEKGFFPVRMK